MCRHLILTSLFLCLGWGLSAQASVEGHLYFGLTEENPVANALVVFYLADDLVVAEGQTDENGYFYLSTDAAIVGGPVWWVETLDFCTGELIRAEFEVVPTTTHYEQDIYICTGTNPPPPPDTCQAFFSGEQQFQSESPLRVRFYDLSFGPPPADGQDWEWQWDFGDGNTSAEASPLHTYAEAGIYVVSLTIVRGDCVSATAQDIEVVDLNNCDCPTDEVIPVCVWTPSGQRLTFDNGCWAECAGFGAGEWFVCEGDCHCPEIYDPVCVATPGLGLILVFDNACFAECEGYGPDIYYECDGGCVCPEFYSPVCVVSDSGDTLTFDNYCFAECAGYGPDQWMDCEGDACNCPEDLYDPVCVQTATGVIVFNNACEAECAGFAPGIYQPCEGDCECPDIYEPVCVVDPATGDFLVFDNYCLAQCAGYEPGDWSVCDPDPCDCPADVYDPVCIATASGAIISFPNPCYAECAGYTPDQWESCEQNCHCPEYYDPVCVTLDSGEELEFTNACFAQCAGYSPGDWVACGEDCDCPPEVYDPVCVATSSGTLTFVNPCVASCAGYTEADFVDCEDECICPEIWDPVCVVTTTEVTVFPNACYAECAGFSADDFLEDCPVDCQCEDVYDPVCVFVDDTVLFFPNACEARCAGYTDDQLGACDPACDCSDEWDPVCVLSPNGAELMFANACEASCAGYDPDQFVECTDCNCDDFYLPVCVRTAAGELLEFPNPCTAVCAGYGPDQILACDDADRCRAEFTFDFLPEDALRVQFHDLSYLEGGTTSWFWELGDGSTSTEPAPLHTYATPGVYEVVLTVSNESCGERSVRAQIGVGEGGGVPGPDCQAFFFLEQPDPDNLLTFQFLNLSFGQDAAYLWDFGDGNTSTAMNPLYSYEAAGTYALSLTVFGENCTNTVTISVTAGENIWYGDLNCRAWFLPLLQPDSNAVFFINLSSPDATAFQWDFGDGTTSEDPLAYHQYAAAGTYTVSLTITTAAGCSSTFHVTLDFGADNFSPAPTFSLVNDTEEVSSPGMAPTAWPNPTNGLVTVSGLVPGEALSWQLFNLNGRQLQRGQWSASRGEVQLQVDLAALPDGIYLLRLQGATGLSTLRLSKF